ncbi:hypothetical protein AXG93_2987s1000 [Marchantia polymorpha subsp. ruderalis]|uniref:Uncharacterized protein n=1 Tax=Marchantia polymorpha subsp. ruderalis TaxID=1480154 RepID=A0A176WSJ2_MARPO|nr:hypothetical protein AXG93_2987s1000 [Marchantia polymorpha subsp. ruderalis]
MPVNFKEYPQLRQIWDWKKVLEQCVGEDCNLTFDDESIKVTRAEEKTYCGPIQEIAHMQEWVSDDRISRSTAKEYSSSADADPLTFPNNLHDDLAVQICRKSFKKKTHPLGADSMTHVVDGDESRSANEVDIDQEKTQLALPLATADRPVPTKLRSANVRARTKMKAKRLLIDDDGSTEGSVAASQGRLTLAKWVELEAEIAGIEEEGTSEKDLWCSELRPSAVLKEDTLKEVKEKEADTRIKTSNWKPEPLARTIVYTPLRKKSLEVLAVSSDTT